MASQGDDDEDRNEDIDALRRAILNEKVGSHGVLSVSLSLSLSLSLFVWRHQAFSLYAFGRPCCVSIYASSPGGVDERCDRDVWHAFLVH